MTERVFSLGGDVVDVIIQGGVSVPGLRGPEGPPGGEGPAASINVGTTTTGAAGSSASVVNSGTSASAILNFTIPRGDTGAPGANGTNGTNGAPGAAATIAVGTVTTGAAGSSAVITNVGTSSAAVFNFTIPRGDAGAGAGDVVGPAGATTDALAQFSGATGKLLKSGPALGVAAAGDVPTRAAGDTRWEQVSNKAVANGYASLNSSGNVPSAQLNIASATTIRAGTSTTTIMGVKNTADAMAMVAITRAAAASGLDFATFTNASILLDANLTVGGWIVGYPGKTGIIRFVQDATGGRTVSWAAGGYIVPAGFAVQATANGVTDVPYFCEADNKIRLYNPSKWTA